MYLTARSYLLAGFTAASIVATIPFAPRTTVHMPDIHAADVRLAAAESQIAATMRTLRAVEARTVAGPRAPRPSCPHAGLHRDRPGLRCGSRGRRRPWRSPSTWPARRRR